MSHRKSRPVRRETIELLYDHGLWLPTRTVVVEHGTDGVVGEHAFLKLFKGLVILRSSPEPITIILNSPGGNCVDGLAMFDAISELPNHVTVKVYGEAASMGAVILQAADHRVMTRSSEMLLHDGATNIEGVHRDVVRYVESTKLTRERFYQIFADRTGQKKEYFRRKMAHDWFITPEQALKEGLIDEIVDAGRSD